MAFEVPAVEPLKVAFSISAWKVILAVFVLINIKALPFVWHLRFLRTLIRRLTAPVYPKPLCPECLFLPAITVTRSPLMECDYNIHKSNSTYFTDLDISRGNLSLLLFREKFEPRPGPNQLLMILGGVQCVFGREIKPYQPYELWTRVLSWDDKWIYLVSHFIERGRFIPYDYYLQPKSTKSASRASNRSSGGNVSPISKQPEKLVFASSVARYVFKNGRVTVPPEKVLRDCGLLPSVHDGALSSAQGGQINSMTAGNMEKLRKESLPIAQLHRGWDAVHGLFQGGETLALGRYTDLIWR